MASTSETGHAKNLANFDEVITSAITLGEAYNPSKPSLKLSAMQELSGNCKTSVLKVKTATAAYKSAVDSREVAFAPLNSFSSRVGNALKASDTTDQTDQTAMSYIRKIQGRRASPKRSVEEKKSDVESGIEIRERSSSQMSFDNRIDNFEGLIQLLIGITQYAPNEKELQVESLKAFSDDLKKKNSAVVSASIELGNARASRNELMYKPITGLVDIALDAKTYIKSVFGTKSNQYKQVSKLDFTKIRA